MIHPPRVPCYVYDQREIERACRGLTDSLPGVDFLYSVKANPFPLVVALMAGQGFGADAASAHEVALALQSGMAPGDIYYSSPGKTAADIQRTLGRCVLIADSVNELMLIDQAAAGRGEAVKVGIRVHPDFAMDGSPGGASKFGISMDCMGELAGLLKGLKHVRAVGIHVHVKSQELSADVLAGYYLRVMALAVELRETLGIPLEFVNFGSGIGAVYDENVERPVDLAALGRAFDPVRRMNQAIGARLLIETGRHVVCRAGRYMTRVVDRKESHGQTYVIVQNGLNGFMRPAIAHLLRRVADVDGLAAMEPLFTSGHECQISVLNDADEQETVTIVGNLCTAMDVIGRNVTVNRAQIGDLVQVTNAGSYGFTLSPLGFAGQEAPAEYLLSDGQWAADD